RDYFRLLADSLPEAVLALSGDGRQVSAANHAFLLLSGYARNEISKLDPAELFIGEAGERTLSRVLGAWEASEAVQRDVPMRTRQGDVLRVDVRGWSAGSPRGGLVLVLRPSDERKREADQRLVRDLHLSRLVDLSRQALDGTAWSPSEALALAREYLGASVAGLYRLSSSGPEYVLEGNVPAAFPASLPMDALESLHRPTLWNLGQRPESPLARAARGAGVGHLRTMPVGTTGAWIGIVIAGWDQAEDAPSDVDELMQVVTNLCHASLVLTAQRETITALERSMQQMEAELRGHSAAVGDGVLALDDKLQVREANARAAEILGYRPGELDGMPVQDVLVGPEDVRTTLLDALGHDRAAERSRLILHRRDGTPFPVQMRVRPLAAAARSRLLVVLHDQSQQEAIETQTEILAQRALLGEVSAIFAHEVRNPINNISTGVQFVASRLGREHPLHESLERVRKECLRLDQLMTDVLFFARPLELKMEPTDLADLMRRTLARWQPRLAQARIVSHTSFTECPHAMIDPRTFEQVVVNLITNAVQAMSNGGTLSVSLAPFDGASGRMVELRIADTGPGIPPEVIERIFDPFFTTKKDGTGLGLAISRRILAAHKGTVTAESFPDAGTVFTLRLPSAPERPNR
ncbi:MAG TPA: ATP-binding protein, partial [Anaerolineales bacterium]|nr:ATP-binding protein [Anaerolineales bacterium]